MTARHTIFLILYFLLNLSQFVTTDKNMVIIWGQVFGTSTPENKSYSNWNDCVKACSNMDNCVATVSENSNDTDGCKIYLYNKISSARLTSENTTKLAIKIDLNDSTCPSISQNPPLFGKSVVYMSTLNSSTIASAKLAKQRKNIYSISKTETGELQFNYGGCLPDEAGFTRRGTDYCIKKYNTLVANYSNAAAECAKNDGFVHTSLDMNEYNALIQYIGNYTMDYWVEGRPCVPKCQKDGAFYDDRLEQIVYGRPNKNHCTTVCKNCLRWSDGFKDTECTNAPAGFICIFNL